MSRLTERDIEANLSEMIDRNCLDLKPQIDMRLHGKGIAGIDRDAFCRFHRDADKRIIKKLAIELTREGSFDETALTPAAIARIFSQQHHND